MGLHLRAIVFFRRSETYLIGRIASFCSGEHERVCTLVFDIRRIYLYVTDRI